MPTLDPTDLDAAYTALAEALARVGEARVPLLLATLSLSLLARAGNLQIALAEVEGAERLAQL